MTLWILWSILASALIAVAAMAVERVATFVGAPRRFIWMLAIVAAALAPVVLALRSAPPVTTPEPALAVVPALATPGLEPSQRAGAVGTDALHSPRTLQPQPASPIETRGATTLRIRADDVSRRAFAFMMLLSRDADPWVVRAWLIASLVLLVALIRSLFALRTLRTGWREAATEIGSVFVTRDAGPAVVGFIHPRIVIPGWALALAKTNRDMLLRHEAEHVDAGDSRVLFASEFLRVLFPWNAALWWMIRQLRLAIEIDCDDRVIRAGATARGYGLLLLAVGERYAASLPLAASLSEPHMSLETRIDAITTPRPRRPILASIPFATAALLLLTAAATSPRPRPLLPASRLRLGSLAIGNTPAHVSPAAALHPTVLARSSNPMLASSVGPAATRGQGTAQAAPQRQWEYVDTRRVYDTIPAGSTERNADLYSLVARILFDERTRISRDANGQLRSAVVVTQEEVAAAISMASEKAAAPANDAELQGFVARILLYERARAGRDANGQLRSTINVTSSEAAAAIDSAKSKIGEPVPGKFFRLEAETPVKRPPPGQSRDTTARITVEFQRTDIREVLRIFGELGGRTIIVQKDVAVFITTSIKDQPWKAALISILDSQGLFAVEGPSGIITIDKKPDLARRLELGTILGDSLSDSRGPTPHTSNECPVYVIDGVAVMSSWCEVRTKKSETPKCDPTGPIFVIDGVVQSAPCGKPSPRDSTSYFHLRNPN